LKNFIFIAILRGNLGKSEPECDLTEQEVNGNFCTGWSIPRSKCRD
jgi:hypothetical protein